ncbi:anhydro-N-acetylmuramic acid kinase [Seonamhaeicola sp. ML3]|uniref:anhydro-N-acetylmuramic acid kinase n=1 Tax=Seonamhaeicola sp. ML3 TaxID=2937786 RepID=UPI00200EF1FD|nr:anhydro-N-acetylmuramic acid kinase [Seonamhaeicola sp. ML3]
MDISIFVNMIKSTYNVIGLMSGTSLDGIDLVYATFSFKEKWSFKINDVENQSYNKHWKQDLGNLVNNTKEELKHIDEAYTAYLAKVINGFIKDNHIVDIDAVCSHGHTALHQPHLKLTYQIGNLPKLATLLNQLVVCDFRVQDVELGGQGAPLVPIGDKLLFSDYDYCINLGGFANISTEIDNERIAYDICPVNIVLNHYVKSIGLEYDDKGSLSASGDVNTVLLEALNELAFYKKPPPKSLGLEWVQENILPLIDKHERNLHNILRTFVEHIVIQIANSISGKPQSSVLITGGGAYHLFLMERIRELSGNDIIVPSNEIVEFKEALIFGFLGVLKLRDEINCLQSVTGAAKSHSSGKVYMP